jgi:hypothetical protein
MRLSFVAGAALLSLAVAQPAAADPKSVLDNLGKKTPTLLDLSLARLEAFLQADANAKGYYAFASVDEEKIKIYAWSPEHPGTEDACRKLLTHIRTIAGIDPETGWPLDPASSFANYFNYPSFTAFDVDPSYDETVDSMFELTVTIGMAGDGEAVICKGPLLSKDMTFSKE